jgi:hypothetical protein
MSVTNLFFFSITNPYFKMKRITFLTKITALMAVVVLAGTTYAQAPSVPSLVTQQLRLSSSTGGPGGYINLRAGTGPAATDANPYFLDAPPTATPGEGYALWLDQANHIRTSIKFSTTGPFTGGIGGPGYLYRVNNAGTGTEWVLPSDITGANNGLVVDVTTNPGTAIVQLGDSVAAGSNPLTRDRYVNLGTHNLNFMGGGGFNVGATGVNTNMIFDQGATGTINMPNVIPQPTPSATDRLLILDNTSKNVFTRALTSLVDANNGLTIDVGGAVPVVQLGDSATGIGQHPLGQDRYVTLGTHDLHFQGVGNFVIGDGTATTGLTVDPGAAGFITLNQIDAATVAPSDRMLILDNTNHVLTRNLTSLIQANEGTTIDSSTGTAIVQLGHVTDGQSQITTSRFITMTGAAPALTWNGTGKFNLGTTGNLGVSINNGTDSLLVTNSRFISSAVVASPAESRVHNLMYVDEATNAVHAVTATGMARNDSPTDYVAIDPATGNIVKAISPTAAIARGQEPWTGWQQTITLSGTQVIAAGAAITVSLQNPNTGGTVAIQVTSVTPGTGAAANFHIETSDVPPSGAGEFINWVVINP